MARKPLTDQLIHCNACGEDYSSTYRRCPFCGERVNSRPATSDEDFDDGYVFDGQALFDEPESDTDASAGGRRLAASGNTTKKSRYDTPIINWVRIATYGISLIIIIAALIIVFAVIYPAFRSDSNAGNEPGGTPPVSESPSGSQTPDVNPSDEPEDPVVDPSDDPVQSDDPVVEPSPDPGLISMTLSTYDFTLRQGESWQILVTLNPEDWDGELVWTSSNEEYATVSANGTVTNVNTTSSLRRVVITVTCGDVSQSCDVYCRGVTVMEDPPEVNTEAPSEGSGNPALTPGTVGYIVGASGGLRVRSGPGTTYDVQASLLNGDEVTILEDAGNGWYRINYGTSTGYIMGDFIQVR